MKTSFASTPFARIESNSYNENDEQFSAQITLWNKDLPETVNFEAIHDPIFGRHSRALPWQYAGRGFRFLRGSHKMNSVNCKNHAGIFATSIHSMAQVTTDTGKIIARWDGVCIGAYNRSPAVVYLQLTRAELDEAHKRCNEWRTRQPEMDYDSAKSAILREYAEELANQKGA